MACTIALAIVFHRGFFIELQQKIITIITSYPGQVCSSIPMKTKWSLFVRYESFILSGFLNLHNARSAIDQIQSMSSCTSCESRVLNTRKKGWIFQRLSHRILHRYDVYLYNETCWYQYLPFIKLTEYVTNANYIYCIRVKPVYSHI